MVDFVLLFGLDVPISLVSSREEQELCIRLLEVLQWCPEERLRS